MLAGRRRWHLCSPASVGEDEVAEDVVVYSRGVAQQVGHAGVGQALDLLPVEFRDVVDEGTVEADQSVLDEAHHGRRGDGLRAGIDGKDRTALQGWRRVVGVAHPEGLVQHHHASARYQHYEAWGVTARDPTGGQVAGVLDHGWIHSGVFRYTGAKDRAGHLRFFLGGEKVPSSDANTVGDRRGGLVSRPPRRGPHSGTGRHLNRSACRESVAARR